jgi:sec-independent protein translocase protein TatC
MNNKFQYHLYVLRRIFFLLLIFCPIVYTVLFSYSEQCIAALAKPLLLLQPGSGFLSTNMAEQFNTKLGLTLILGSVIIVYLVAYHSFVFVQIGLAKSVNKRIFLSFTFLTFGGLFCLQVVYLHVLPAFFMFLSDLQIGTFTYLFNSSFQPRLSDYVEFSLFILIGLTSMLLYPIILLILVYNKLVDFKFIVKYRKFMYLKIMLIATFLSPPDLVTQAFMLLLLILLIEIYLYFYYSIK